MFSIHTGILYAQEDTADTTDNGSIHLFIDCRSCDMNFLREELSYINFVREVRDAEVYLKVTTQSTGGGGSNYTLYFSGQGKFAGIADTLKFNTGPDYTRDVIRTGLKNTMSLGLARYIAKTPEARNLYLAYGSVNRQAPRIVADPWDYWVFEVETSPRFSLEKREREYTWSNRLSANRVTPEWKIQNWFNHSYRLNVFFRESEDDETGEIIVTRTDALRKSWNFSNLTVMSLSDHWSTGFRVNASSSTYSNLDFSARFYPAIEYNIFPYSEANRRQVTFLYGVGYIYNNYTDTTVYDKTEENLFEQSLDIGMRVEEKWGSVNVSFGASAYLNDLRKNSFELNGSLRIRLFKGVSLSINGGMEFIHNQIELAKGNRSDEEIFLRLKALQTNFRYDGGVGITYTFGSIYNNVVNPRF